MKSRASGKVAVSIRKSQKRCLKAANLIEKRLEFLAMLDYKPLFSGRDTTLAGEMFNLRTTERAADLESLTAVLSDLAESNPDEYASAVNQYDSALTATEADFALLKILILLREYATHTSRFLTFLEEYEPPEDLDLSFLGDTPIELIEKTCKMDFSRVMDEATTILAQLLAMLNCSTYGVTPYRMVRTRARAQDGKILSRVTARSGNSFIETVYDLANISRDLTFSREMTRIRDDQEPDEAYAELIKELYGENFLTSANDISVNILSLITGTSAYSNLRSSLDNQNGTRNENISGFIDNKNGAMSVLVHDGDIAIAETNQVQYNGKTYDSIDPVIDEAFSGESVLDFTEFSEMIEKFTAAFERVAFFGKTSFRLLEKASESDGKARGEFPLVQNEQPLSMASITAAIYDVFNRRFASTLWTSISSPYEDWLTPEHINYNRVMAWLIIRDNPSLAQDLIWGAWQDYDNGYLTVAGLPEPIEGTAELDDDGEEIEGTEKLSELVYIKPTTGTPVNLTGVGSHLLGQCSKINRYFEDDVPQMSPSNTLSGNEADGISWPPIRTQYERRDKDFHELFGSGNFNGDGTPGDLRLINPVFAHYYRLYPVVSSTDLTTSKQYLGCKILACEIIDAALEVIRNLVTPFQEVEAAGDGDAVFPFVPQMKSPYGTDNGYWGYSGGGYEQFQLSQWVSTIEGFDALFTRSNSKRTYMRRQEVRRVCYKIIEIFSYLMESYDFLRLRMETINASGTVQGEGMAGLQQASAGNTPDGVFLYSKSSGTKGRLAFLQPITATIKYKDTDIISFKSAMQDIKNNDELEEACEALSDIFSDMLDIDSFSNWDTEINGIQSNLPVISTSDGTGGDFAQANYGIGGGNRPTADALTLRADLMLAAHREDVMLSFQLDFLEKYASRVDNYKQATMDLVEGEGSPLATFVTTMRELGDAGTDILQNLSVNQLALKQVALEEEKADIENAYLPTISVISDAEINSIKVLCQENILKAPEGSTTKVVMVGIPLNTFDQNNIDNIFCLRLSYRDIEYPQLVFRSKSYKFDKDVYILPEHLEGLKNKRSFSTMLSAAKFSRIRVEVIESTDITASIELLDDVESISSSATERTGSNKDAFSNLLVSEILKLYYRVMLGVSFSEVQFLSTTEDLKIPISETSVSLAASMTENVEKLSTLSANLGTNVQDIINGITSFENPDDFMPGEISDVDEALLGDLKNAYQTRLFSPELLRNRTLAAKMFDRIYALPVDPDEFYIVPPGQPQIGVDSENSEGLATPPEVFDYYLNAGIIETTGLDAPYEYKLAPRKTAEGSMALGTVTVAMTTVDDEAEGVLGL